MAIARPCKEWESSPERNRVWTETTKTKKVAVVYYLSRNGQLEHPHFMEVTLSSKDGLFLRDVIHRLNFLRGNGMANSYSWSSKRSYKNGFVWHDLSEGDFIYPVHGQEYVLKGTELLHSPDAASDFPMRRKKTPGRSLDLGDYKFCENKSAAAEACGKGMDAATQTEGEIRRRREVRQVEDDGEMTEVSCEVISPPPSSSSSEALDALVKEGGSLAGSIAGGDGTEGCPSGRFRSTAAAALMHLISCGSISARNRSGKYPLPTLGGSADRRETREMDGPMGMPGQSVIKLEDREYFSGSLIEKKKTQAGDGATAAAVGLKRSTSYNADRSSMLGLDGVRAGQRMLANKTTAASTAKDEDRRP